MSDQSLGQDFARSDHDLLIAMNTRLIDLLNDNREFKKDLSRMSDVKVDKSDVYERITRLEQKLDDTSKDHETRMRRTERMQAMIGGAIIILQFILNK